MTDFEYEVNCIIESYLNEFGDCEPVHEIGDTINGIRAVTKVKQRAYRRNASLQNAMDSAPRGLRKYYQKDINANNNTIRRADAIFDKRIPGNRKIMVT